MTIQKPKVVTRVASAEFFGLQNEKVSGRTPLWPCGKTGLIISNYLTLEVVKVGGWKLANFGSWKLVNLKLEVS